MSRSIVVFLSLLAVVACSRAGSDKAAPTGSRSLLLADEIRAIPELATAYEAVQRLRPEFLRIRPGPVSFGPGAYLSLTVYVNGMKRGGVEVLNRLRAAEIRSIRYLNGRDATTRYGTGHGGGVLEVTTGG